MIPWIKITNLGDVTIMTAIVAAIAVGFVMKRAWSMTFWWCFLIFAGMLLVLATKVAFLGWGVGIESLDFAGISGHAARAVSIIPVLCYLIVQRKSRVARTSGIVLGVALGMFIAISRVVLRFHSTSEIVAGCVLGIIISLCFLWMLRRARQFELSRPLIVFSLIALLAAPHAAPMPTPTQRWAVRIALYLSGRDVPYSRNDWKSSRFAHADESKAWEGRSTSELH